MEVNKLDINYTMLILGNDITYSDKITIHVPKIVEITQMEEVEFNNHIKPFVISVRELFSGMPEVVDRIEDEFPTLWDMAFNDEMNSQVGYAVSQHQGTKLHELIINGLAYWTNSDRSGFKILSNKKIVNKSLGWVIDKAEYQKFSKYIKIITLSQPNEDLIAPRDMSKTQMKVWENLYKGRLRKLQKAQKTELGDKILILQGSTSYIPFREIAEMTYYQFSNLIRVYAEREKSDTNLQFYTAYKFDTKEMKLQNWRENISLIKE